MESNKDIEFIELEALGKGSFGQVVRVINKKTGEHLALKVFQLSINDDQKHKEIKKIEIEIKILEKLSTIKSKNIVKYYGNWHNDKCFGILMELGICNLQEIIDHRKIIKKLYMPNYMLFIFKEILSGYNDAKTILISNRDLKPVNIVYF